MMAHKTLYSFPPTHLFHFFFGPLNWWCSEDQMFHSNVSAGFNICISNWKTLPPLCADISDILQRAPSILCQMLSHDSSEHLLVLCITITRVTRQRMHPEEWFSNICPPEDIWQCLEMSLIVTARKVLLASSGQSPNSILQCTTQTLHPRIMQLKPSVMPRLRKLALE